ncbi:MULTISPECIES: Tex family protein [Gammaproteobacteria]|uniref:Tex family protein n=1 Tax=Gammaproteobacteria TaxID=1236 RepID=UPI000DD0BA87|nr:MULTISPECIES: Tex family protein [Gammaproteobacteria]RTE86452.1 RNA-binding transcriptional accessory protein [Aliidiomarina sp. B3213]TCZ90993.1 RNA-binding transcriptional accessory protein [Lysobacter sp. N42]
MALATAEHAQILEQIASELNVKTQQVSATVQLIDEGSTVPFIARYRKEVTGGLDDTQLRNLATRLTYLRELSERKAVILKSIQEQEKLTPELSNSIQNCTSKTELEDLYLPYKPKRRTKGQIAIEAGIEPLADQLLTDNNADPEALAAEFINAEAGFEDTKAVLEGARFIVMERFSEDAQLLKEIRQSLWQQADITSQMMPGKESEGAKFRDYFEYAEPIKKVPSHRTLAMLRGRNEGVLQLKLQPEPHAEEGQRSAYEEKIAQHFNVEAASGGLSAWRLQAVQWTWRVKILPRMETDLLGQLRDAAEEDAIKVFAKNLKDLLMAAPAGQKTTLGLDPGLRTGVKATVVDQTGKLVGQTTTFPHAPQNQWDKSLRSLAALCKQHKVELIAIGNGTASRETDKLAGELVKALPELKMQKVMVSEAGASVYSASELAAQEFPDLDVSYRGAVSIARRLQDPLAELVKIEPKSIGVGQYQHDVSQSLLATSLDAVVEDCVNAVGVDLNMASVPLLARVAGLNRSLAQNIVQHRDQNGAFDNRKALLEVSRLGPKAFEQAAGFLRVTNGSQPLDASSVHPEAYPLVEKIAEHNGKALSEIIGQSDFLRGLNPNDFTDDNFGLPTVSDILKELEKPGRDPRPEFKTAEFKEGVETLEDLKPNMQLEGVVTNVTNFGAFVDIGVHQDGLVHISSLSHEFVSDPHKVVKAGQVVKVKVLDVDLPRKRISLTMRMDDQAGAVSNGSSNNADRGATGKATGKTRSQASQGRNKQEDKGNSAMGNAFAAAFANAKKK